LVIEPHSLTVANRTLTKTQQLQEDFPQVNGCGLDDISGVFDLIINATSASLEGKIISLPSQVMAQKPLCYDLAYNKLQATPFVNYAKESGCDAVDGIGMLVEQAAEAFFIWNKVMPETKSVLELMRQC
jgi:shikimate dehydrogenase